SQNNWIMPSKRSEAPLPNAVTAFTNAGKKSRRAVVTWLSEGVWHHRIPPAMQGDSLQTLELAAVVWTVLQWHDQGLNIVNDSLYVAGVLQRIEDARLKEIKNPRLYELF
ncbi:PO113 protein, partial [Columbina picui]|nr:PO113 protein [Columbina picui]